MAKSRLRKKPREEVRVSSLGKLCQVHSSHRCVCPCNESNPLPVLVSIDEAFYGPNNTRIPLKGAFAIGKAVGDTVSKRAIIQVVSFSTVLPDGKVFEHEANLGYLADSDGRLGIQGELIYNTGKQLSLSFLSGFLAGGSEALSQAETSTVTGAYGQTSKNVTGNTGRYSMFSGLANSAQGMSSYYQKQLEAMIPAVKIEAGKKLSWLSRKECKLKALKHLTIILVLLITNGCAASKGLVKDSPNKVMDVYLEAVASGRTDAVNYIKENLKVNKAFGYVKPYVPVVEPADVRLVWLPAHKSKYSSEVLVSGHWVYIMVKESRWFIDTQEKGNAKIPLIVPYKETSKK